MRLSVSSRPEAARCNASFSRPTCSSAAMGIWVPCCTSGSRTANCSTPIGGWPPVLSPPCLVPSTSSAWATPAPARIFPLDRALTLPARSFSYELQRRLVKAAVQNPFLDSVQTIADLTGVSVSKRSLEQILPDAAQDFDAFYRQRSPEPATGT